MREPADSAAIADVSSQSRRATAVVLQHFATAEDMDAGAQAFSAMDPGDTPGTRTSVDMCEVKLEVEVS